MARSPKKSPAPTGFEEAPQAPFEGAPLSGSVSDWVKQLEADAEMSGIETQREIASKAGKHRKKVEIAASKSARGTSMGAHYINGIQERFLDWLDHEIVHVSGTNSSPVVSKVLEQAALAGQPEIAAGLKKVMEGAR